MSSKRGIAARENNLIPQEYDAGFPDNSLEGASGRT